MGKWSMCSSHQHKNCLDATSQQKSEPT